MTERQVFAPAKVNLTLHITGQRSDGYHLLDSLVAFADVGDRLTVSLGGSTLTVSGPRAAGVPLGPENLVLRAASHMGVSARIHLEKHLPAAAGIGGGSSDAAAVLKALADLTGHPVLDQGLALGADVPVCMVARGALMQGIGETITPVALPPLSAVLINPGVAVSTGAVFSGLISKENPAMDPMPPFRDALELIGWLRTQRNDLEAPACAAQPVISDVLVALQEQGAMLARMSGSGATCFGLFADSKKAAEAALNLARPNWWVAATELR